MRSKLYIIRYTLYILLSTILTTGCVLTMEDYTKIPEEERGVGKPYTYEDSLVSCTYEFREGVVPITDRWFPYVLGTQDSTVYISDNIPEDWLPKPGEYVSAGCSRTFPLGLCHRVQSMNRQSGMFAMTLTGATTDEVFKELDIVVDLDSYTLPGMDLTPDTTDQPSKVRRFTRGGEEDPHIAVLPTGEIVDFRFVDAAMESPERKYLKPKTRAGNDYTTDGDHSVTDTDEDVDPVHWGCEFEFDPSFLSILWSKAANLKGIKPKLTFSIDKTVHVTAHKEEWKSQKKSEEWNQKTVKKTFSAKITLSAELDEIASTIKNKGRIGVSKADLRAIQKVVDVIVKVHDKPKLVPKLLSKALSPFYITFTVGCVPCSIRISFEIEPSVVLACFGELTYTATEPEIKTTTIRNGDNVKQTKETIREGTSDWGAQGGGSLELSLEERISVGFCVGGNLGAVGFDVGAGCNQSLTFDLLSGPAKGTTDRYIDTVYNKSGMHFTFTNFIDFEVFMDWLGQPVANKRIRPEHLKWTPITKHKYFYPVLDNKQTNGTYKYDYTDPANPVVHHDQKIVFAEGHVFDSDNDGVFPVLLVYKKRLDSNPEVITPYNYTGHKSKNSDGCYPFEPKEAYYYKCDSDPRSDFELWFSPALMYKDGRIDEYRAMSRKWGGIVDTKLKHLELYQKSSNEKDDTKKLYNKDWDFYHIDDILEVTYVPWDYLKVGYIINVVDAKNRNVIKNSDVYVMGFNMNTATDNVTKPGVYKVSFDIGIPSDGREHPILQNVPSIKTYPILTVQPYWEIIDQETLKHKTVMGEEKSIKLQFPYTTDYSYKKANFTKKITQPIRQ